MKRPTMNLRSSTRHLLRATLVGAVLVGGGQLAAVPAVAATAQNLVIVQPTGAGLQKVPGDTWQPTLGGGDTTVVRPFTITPADPSICTASSGIVTFRSAGTCSVSVQAPSDATHDASNTVAVSPFTVTAHGTSTALTAPATPPRAMEATTLTATVTPATGAERPTGSVAFWDLGSNLGSATDDQLVDTVLLAAGSGVTSIATKPVTNPLGTTRTYDARYLPTVSPATHSASTSAQLAVTSTKRALAVTVAVAPGDPATATRPSTVTVTAKDALTDDPVQPSAATLEIGGQSITLSTWSGGVATGTYNPTAGSGGGPKSVVLSFVPTVADRYAAPTVTVNPSAVRVIENTTTTLTTTDAGPLAKDSVTLDAGVTATGGLPLAGTLEIVDVTDPLDEDVVGTETVTGTTTTTSAPVSNDAPTERTYVARFTPADTAPATSTHAASESDDVEVASGQRPTTVTVAFSPGPATIGRPTSITVTATDTTTTGSHVVSPAAGSGKITIGAETIDLAWTAGVGTATFTPTGAVGSRNVSVDFASTDAYADPVGTLAQLRVIDGTTTTLTPTYPATTPTPLAKDTVTLGAAVTATGGLPLAGTLEIVDVTDPLDEDVLRAETVTGTTTTTSTTVRNDASTERKYVARFTPADTSAATSTHSASASAALAITSKPRPTTVTVAISPRPAAVGRPSTVTVTARDTTTAGTHVVSPATGSGKVKIGAETIDLTWAGGVGTGSFTPTGAVGDRAVAVDFAATDAYADPTGTVADLRVVDATTTTLAPLTASPRAKEATTLTATVTATSGTVDPTGQIEFLNQAGATIATVGLTADSVSATYTATATHTVTSGTTGARTYRARYVPTGSTGSTDVHAAGTSPASTITSVPRPLDVTVTVTNPNPGVVDTPSTVTLTPTDPHAALVTGYTPADGNKVVPDTTSTTVTVDGHTVSLAWLNGIGTGSYTPTTVGGDHLDPVAVTFVPATTNVYDTPTVTAPANLRLLDETETELDLSTTAPLVEDPVDLTATVTATTGTVTPTGKVEFVDQDGTVVATDTTLIPVTGTAAHDAVAVATVIPLDTSPRTYTARYVSAGAPTTDLHDASASPVSDTVTAVLRTATVEVVAPTVAQGQELNQPITLTVTATDDDDTTKDVHGSATVVAGGTALGTVTFTDGEAEFTYTPLTVGLKTVVVTVDLRGDANVASYAAVTVPDRQLTIRQQQSPTATATPSGTVHAGDTVTVGATGAHGALSVAHAPGTTDSDCTIAGLQVTLVRAPACDLLVTAAGTDAMDWYFAKTVQLSIDVDPQEVTVDVVVAANPAVYGDRIVVRATATAGTTTPLTGTGVITWVDKDPAGGTPTTLSQTYTYGGPDVVLSRARTASTGPVTLDADEYVVTVTYQPLAAQTGVYEETSGTRDLVIGQRSQAITTAAVPTLRNVGDVYVANPVGGTSGNDVERTVDTPLVCDEAPGDADTIVFKTVGTCTLLYDQLGNDNYSAAPQHEVTFTVDAKQVQLSTQQASTPSGFTYESQVTLTLAAADQRVLTTPVPGTATRVVERTTTTTATETVPDGVLTTVDTSSTATLVFAPKSLVAGSYRVTFTFTPKDALNFAAQTAVAEFDIQVATQQVVLSSVRPKPASAEVTSTWLPSFVSTASGKAVAVTPNAATSVPEDLADYARLPVTDAVTGTTITRPTATCGPGTGPANTVLFLAQGTCHLTAVVPAAPDRYSSTTVDIPVTVARIANTLYFETPTGAEVENELKVRAYVRDSRSRVSRGYGDFSVSRITSAAGLPEVLEELPQTAGDNLTEEWFGGGRSANFVARNAGPYRVSGTFDPINPVVFAPVRDTTTFAIGKASQTIRQDDRPTARKVRDDWTTNPTGGNSGKPVVLVVDDAPSAVCRAEDKILRFTGAGVCHYSFTQDGNANYLPTTLGPFEIVVTQTLTTLTLAVPTDARVGVETTITATALAGQQPVPGTVGTITVTTADGTVSAVPTGVTSTWVNGVGTLRFVPTLAGTAAKPLKVTASFTPTDPPAYSSATDEEQLLVATGVQEILVPTDHGPTAFVDDAWTPGESAGGNPAGLVVTSIDDSTAGACTRDSGTGRIRFAAPGTCRVSMTMAAIPGPQTGSPTTWAAAPAKTWDITVSSHPLQLVLSDIPSTELLYGSDIPIRVQVIGDRGLGSERVTGQVTFLVDDVALPGTVAVDGAGQATTTIRFIREAGESASDQHTIRVKFVPDNALVPHLWATADRTWPQTVQRVTPTISADPNYPADMRVGQVWTPALRTSAPDRSVVVSAEPVSVCTSDGRSVTAVGAGAGLPDCQLTYSVPGDTVYAPRSVVGPAIGTSLRAVTVVVDAAPSRIAQPVDLTATVGVPPYPDSGAPGSGLTTAPAEDPAGTVTFRLDDADGTVITGVALVGGVATTSYTPVTDAALTVTAEFVPAHPERHVSGMTGQDALVVAPVPTSTAVSMTGSSITATVSRDYDVRAPINGLVDFSWSPLETPTEVHDLGSATVANGVAVLVPAAGNMPPADRVVVIRSAYAGGDDHAASGDTYDRLLPRIEASADRDLSGWNNQAVTVSFRCWPGQDSAPVLGACPAAQVFTADGGGQQAGATIVAADGGTASVSLGGIRIDRTDPQVQVTGIKATPYAGEGPVLGCETSDALTTATCAIATKPAEVPGDFTGTVTVTATATDEAGNRSQATATYELVQQWVEGRAPGGAALQVKRGSKFTAYVRTAGPRPQLMLPLGKTFRPGPAFRAISAKDGMVTWKLRYRVPPKLRTAIGGWFGYRLAGEPAASAERLPIRLVKGSTGQK